MKECAIKNLLFLRIYFLGWVETGKRSDSQSTIGL